MREATELAAGAGGIGPHVVERRQLANEAPRLLEIVFFARTGEPDVKLCYMALAQNTDDFPQPKNEKRYPGNARKDKTNEAEQRRPCKKIVDEPGQPKPETKRHKAARGRPENTAPGQQRAGNDALFLRGLDGSFAGLLGRHQSLGFRFIGIGQGFDHQRARRLFPIGLGSCANAECARAGFGFKCHARPR